MVENILFHNDFSFFFIFALIKDLRMAFKGKSLEEISMNKNGESFY
jgi:hypothetical protein